MKKEEKSIVINKDNYKGYVELYKSYHYMSDEEDRLSRKMMNKVFKLFCISLGILAVTAIFVFNPTIKIIFSIECGVLVTSLIGLASFYGKKVQDIKKKNIAMIQEKYPYVDIKVKDDSLEKSLEEARIIQKEYENGLCFKYLKVKEYEDYLKAEEVKKNYLEETKYDKYVVNPEIEEQELEKVKVKVRSLTR